MNSTASKQILFVFGKYPVIGRVKTRLASSIGDSAARQLYEGFLADAACKFVMSQEVGSFEIKWVYTPSQSAFPQLIMSTQSRCAGQVAEGILADETLFIGSDIDAIGTLQEIQLDWARQYGYEMAVIVGTDTPQINRKILNDAFDRLKSHDVVIGPSTDGGYYLLGVKKIWDILAGIDMSTKHVVDDIIMKASVTGKNVGFVETLTDIDDWDDLALLIKMLAETDGKPCPATWASLQTLGLAKLRA